MDIDTLTRFFMWCTIINGALLLVWASISILLPDFIYKTQSKRFPMPRETFTVVFYAFLGLFKIVFITFNLVPYVVLLIVR